MVHVYQPRPVVPEFSLDLRSDTGNAVLCFIDKHDERVGSVAFISSNGLYRLSSRDAHQAAYVGFPLDDNGCIALHSGDPAMRKIAELEARVKELEAPTVAPELTDEEGKRLWRLYVNADGSTLDGMRAMLAAYEAMRRPITDEDVERADEYGR